MLLQIPRFLSGMVSIRRISQLSSVNQALPKNSKETHILGTKNTMIKINKSFGKYSYKNKKKSKNVKAPPQRSYSQGNQSARQEQQQTLLGVSKSYVKNY